METHLNPINEEEEDCLYAIQLVTASVLPRVMEAAIELNIFQIIASAGEGAKLSSSEIASRLPNHCPETPMMLDRLLCLLASYSVLNCTIVSLDNGVVNRIYGLKPICKYFFPNEDGVSFAPWLLITQYKNSPEILPSLKDAAVEGGMAFNKVHGVNVYEYFEKDPKLGELFHRVMYCHTTIVMKKILEQYKGFELLKELVDVAGGIGTMSSIITSKFPTVQCINFDLPEVIDTAPSYPRVKHIGGDMFAKVPKGDTIFLKWILHNWDDEHCLKLLKNCYEALPDHGKVIVVDVVVPLIPETNTAAKGIYQLDILMMLVCSGGKERTQKEFESLAQEAGFGSIKLVCSAYNYWAMEFYKTI